jgi:hypothetical protein
MRTGAGRGRTAWPPNMTTIPSPARVLPLTPSCPQPRTTVPKQGGTAAAFVGGWHGRVVAPPRRVFRRRVHWHGGPRVGDRGERRSGVTRAAATGKRGIHRVPYTLTGSRFPVAAAGGQLLPSVAGHLPRRSRVRPPRLPRERGIVRTRREVAGRRVVGMRQVRIGKRVRARMPVTVCCRRWPALSAVRPPNGCIVRPLGGAESRLEGAFHARKRAFREEGGGRGHVGRSLFREHASRRRRPRDTSPRQCDLGGLSTHRTSNHREDTTA